MIESSDLRTARLPLNHGTGRMPVLGFGTLIPDAATTISATRDALDAGFRHFDCAERYRNEREVGEALRAGLAARGIAREDIFVTTKVPETELLEFCRENGVVLLAFAPLGHGMRPGPLEDPVISAIAARVGKTPAQVLLAWAVQRGTALLTTPRTAERARENFDISALPEEALDEINRIQTRQRFNEVVKTGSPGFIPQVR